VQNRKVIGALALATAAVLLATSHLGLGLASGMVSAVSFLSLQRTVA